MTIILRYVLISWAAVALLATAGQAISAALGLGI